MEGKALRAENWHAGLFLGETWDVKRGVLRPTFYVPRTTERPKIDLSSLSFQADSEYNTTITFDPITPFVFP